MCLLQVGGNEDSNVYIRMKSKAATQCGIAVDHIKLRREVSQLVGVSGLYNVDECKVMCLLLIVALTHVPHNAFCCLCDMRCDLLMCSW